MKIQLEVSDRLVRWVRVVCGGWRGRFLASLTVLGLGTAFAATYGTFEIKEFSPGTKISSAEVNANFKTMAQAVAALQTAVANGAAPVGTVVAFAGTKVPTGWLLCDGAAYTQSKYPELANVIGNTHGNGGGVLGGFNVPDYRGRFLRGRDGGAGRDPDVAKRTPMSSGGVAADNVGSVQADETGAHNHGVATGWGQHKDGGCGFGALSIGASIYATGGGACSGNFLMANPGKESRPANAYVGWIIKY